MSTTAAVRTPSVALVLGFVGLLFTPPLWLAVDGPGPSTAMLERRLPAPPARAPKNLDDVLAWPRKFDAWYADHFPLREQLLRSHNRVVWSALDASPSDLEVRGVDGWLFPTANRGLDVARGGFPFLPSRLDGWKRTLAARKAWLEQRGAVYMLALVPNKEQVYPELVRAPWNERGETRLDQLLAAVGPWPQSPVLDLRESQLSEKARDGQFGADDWTYYRYGGHWTDRGAFAAYEAIVERLAESGVRLRRVGREAFDVAASGGGDTSAPSMYLGELLQQNAWRWSVKGGASATYSEGSIDDEAEWESSQASNELDSLVVFHDSFGPYLRRYFAESFATVGSYWASFDVGIVEDRAPKVVLELFVDRILVQVPPEPRALQSQEQRAADFARLEHVVFSARPLRRSPQVRALGDARLNDVEEGVALTIERGLPMVELDVADLDLGERGGLSAPLLELDLTCPREAVVDVFYRTEREPSYERHSIASQPLPAGRSRVVIELADDGIRGPLQLRFPAAKGGYVLHSLEVRTR